MGQYKTIQRTKLDQQRIQEQLEAIEARIAEAIKDKPIIDLAELRKQLAIPENITDEDIIDIIKRHKPNTPIKLREYHWYNEPPTAKHQIDTKKLRQIAEETAKSFRAHDLMTFMTKTLGIPDDRAKTYMKWFKAKTKKLEIKVLKQFCKDFAISPRKLEDEQVFLDCQFPIKIEGNKALIKLKSHILNEGTLIEKPIAHHEARYVNQDPMLHMYVRQLLKELRREPAKPPLPSKEAMVTYLDSITARILHATGLPYGAKTKTNPPLDPEIFKDNELRKYHIQTTLTEEGSSYLFFSGRYLKMAIVWCRSVDITDILTEDEKEELLRIFKREGKNEIRLGKITNPRILRKINENPPRAINEEVRILTELHAKHMSRDPISLAPVKLRLSRDGRITAAWYAKTVNDKMVRILCEEYGMLPGTWKNEKLKRYYDLYVKNCGRKLSKRERNAIKEVIRAMPRSISEEWVQEKMLSLFPEASWAKDLRSIRRMLKREQEK